MTGLLVGLQPQTRSRRRLRLLAGAATVVTAGLTAAWALLGGPLANEHTRAPLVPWIGLLAATVVAPLGYAWVRGRLDALHPVAYAALVYFLPDFVIGGLVLAAGWSRPYYLALIEAPGYSLPLTAAYLALGFVALALGCAVPPGERLGRALGARLPRLDWPPERLFAPATGLLLAGSCFYYLAFTNGLVGYQAGGPTGPWAATWYFASLSFPLGAFLIWAAAFSTPGGGRARRVAFAVFGLALLARLLLSGSRATLLHAVIAAGFAYIATRRPVTVGGLARFAAAAAASVVLGMAYGSTFRAVKGSEARLGLGAQAAHAATAVRQVAARPPREQVAYVGERLGERLDQLSSVAVIVSNAERLRAEERRLGLDDNILRAARSSLVPRVLWPGKPAVSPPRAYAALYFKYDGNSFALSPVSDLLRNFGPWGIVAGMAALGFVLRTLYGALRGHEGSPGLGRAGLYYLLLSQVSYEDTYAVFLPTLLRVGFVGAAAAAFVGLWLKPGGGRAGAHPER